MGAGLGSGLFVTKRFNPVIGGGDEHTHQIAKHLNELGERVTVLTPSRPDHAEEDRAFDESCGYPVERFRTIAESGRWLTPDFHRRGFFEIAGAARRANADYIMLHSIGGILDRAALLASKLTRRPLLTVTHFLHPRRMPWGAADDLVLRMASKNFCPSDHVASWLAARGVDPGRICVIPNGVDVREIESWRDRAGGSRRGGDGFPDGGPVVLTVARLEPWKGVRTVIRAMPRVVSEVPGARYAIVGDGRDRDHLERLAAGSPVADAITFLGALYGDEKLECYDRCDVFAMPSGEEETFGIVFLEANAFGKPVVGGRLGGVPDAVVDGETGLLVDPHSESEVADAIVRLLKNPDEARRLGENGRRRVENGFTWRKSAEQFLSVIRGIVDSEE